ncbi:MAG: haloacid dehalogenase type II [Rhodospirillales bacterium]
MTAADSQSLSGLGTVVFDAYGTLFDVGSAAARCRDLPADRAEALSSLWRTKQLEYTWLRSLRGDFANFWHVTGEALDYAMAALGLSDAVLRSRLMELYFALRAYPEVPGVLRSLKAAGLRTGILSNGSVSMLVAALQSARLQDLLTETISVDAAGIYKPHPSVYQLAVEKFARPAAEIVFVSSNTWDVAGAAHFGFRVVWVARSGGRLDRLPGAPAATIATLADLPSLLVETAPVAAG